MGKRNKPSEKSLQSREQCTHGPVTHNDKSAALLDDDEQVKKTKRSKIQHYFGKPEVQTSALLSATKSITHYLPATIAKSVQPQIPSLQLPSISAATDLRLVKSSIRTNTNSYCVSLNAAHHSRLKANLNCNVHSAAVL